MSKVVSQTATQSKFHPAYPPAGASSDARGLALRRVLGQHGPERERCCRALVHGPPPGRRYPGRIGPATLSACRSSSTPPAVSHSEGPLPCPKLAAVRSRPQATRRPDSVDRRSGDCRLAGAQADDARRSGSLLGSSVTGLRLSTSLEALVPVAGVSLLSGVGAEPPPDGVR